jgi:ParB family chromosome partitioning protein
MIDAAIDAATVWQERRLGRTIVKTRRAMVDLDDVLPNDKQPRIGPKEDPELQRQIEANEGIFEPLLLEPHPTLGDKFRIIDGDRRWSNSKVLVEQLKKPQYRQLPAEITDHTLEDEERLRVWIYIHRQRKEWDAKEKEMVACRLVELVGRASAANILGVTVREVDKLVEVYRLAERLRNIRDPSASITWAREIDSINKNLLSRSVLDAIVDKINHKLITNSKDVRRLRAILKDPVAKDCFLTEGTTINDAIEKLGDAAPAPRASGLAGDIGAIIVSIRKQPWTALAELRGNADAIRTIEEAEQLLKELKQALKT